MQLINKNSYSNFNLMARELAARGFAVRALELAPRYISFTAPGGGQWLTRWGALSYPFMPVAAKQISVNKDLAYRFAEMHGVVVPKTLRMPEERAALQDFLNMYAPLVVKPASSSGSHGVSLHVRDGATLERAIAEAQQYSNIVLTQQQVSGQEVRFTVVEGDVVSVLQRQTAQVVGNGTSTVAQLIAAENDARRDLQFEYLPYPQLTHDLVDAELLHSTRVPSPGEIVRLNISSMVSTGASVYDISREIHRSYVDTARNLANALNKEFMVVDMMIEDYNTAMTATNYAFMEFNTSPALRLYYGIRNTERGVAYDIVKKLADMIEERIR